MSARAIDDRTTWSTAASPSVFTSDVVARSVPTLRMDAGVTVFLGCPDEAGEEVAALCACTPLNSRIPTGGE